MDRAEARHRLSEAPVAHLATVGEASRPHLVPCCFTLHGETVYSAVDDKPKSTTRLRRIENLASHPAAALLVDHYDEDWARLWWVRLDVRGRLATGDAERARALDLLADKYAQYRGSRPSGPVLALDVVRWSWWEATSR